MPFALGNFKPPINYGIQSPAIGRGGPNMPANSYALHMNAWPPRWLATMLPRFQYPYGTASSFKTIPAAPNLWTGWNIPASNISKQGSQQITF